MSTKKKIFCVIGTRPEYIKTYPVLAALRACEELDVSLVETTQHNSLLKEVYDFFGIRADLSLSLNALHDLQPSNDGEHLAKLASEILAASTKLFIEHKPNLVMVQGDTMSASQVALAAWYLGIPVAHIEAGLRTYDINQPYPEELSRRTIDQIAALNFAPTPLTMDNLNHEQVQGRCFLTGNTVIDSLNYACGQELPDSGYEEKPYVLITAHRRENQKTVIVELAKACERLAQENPDYNFIIIRHANSAANKPFEALNVPNIIQLNAQSYPKFLSFVAGASFIISDSGGIQEEAPYFTVPVLVLRELTERKESLENGLSKLAGTSAAAIYKNASELIHKPLAIAKMREAIRLHPNLYGDGNASKRIVKHSLDFLRAETLRAQQSPLLFQ